MNDARFLKNGTWLGFVVLGLAMVPLVQSAKETSSNAQGNGLRFVAGPVGGSDVALASAKNIRNAGPAESLRVRPPLPVYTLESDLIAAGRTIQESSRVCGFQYLIESSHVPAQTPNARVADLRYVGTAEVQLDPRCASVASILGTGSFGFNTWEAINVLAAHEQVEAMPFEPRLIYATDLKPAPIASPMPIPPRRLVAVWLKSLRGGDDLIYPLVDASGKTSTQTLYTSSEFLRMFRPALDNQIWASDSEMHDYFVDRFLESPGLGMARIVEVPMSIHDTMRLRIASAVPKDGIRGVSVETFKLTGIDLIGIARHSQPVAFVVRGRSHGITAARIDTRQLTAFEQGALTELKSGNPTSVQMDREGRSVIGAVRARQECLQCHAGYKTGDVLGALVYRLSAIPSTASGKVQ